MFMAALYTYLAQQAEEGTRGLEAWVGDREYHALARMGSVSRAVQNDVDVLENKAPTYLDVTLRRTYEPAGLSFKREAVAACQPCV
jgi:hypothetical protein